MKMKTKNLMVFFAAVVCALFLVATISAATTPIAVINSVEIDGVSDALAEDISVVAGETISLKIIFTAIENASDLRVKAELEGEKVDVDSRTDSFDVESGKRYVKRLTLKVPYELKDEESNDLSLRIKVWNGDYKTEYSEIVLRVQRPSYNADIMSIGTSQTIEAGQVLSVDVVLKNSGYNYLDDLYVTARISALGIERTTYFGDLVSIECDDDDGEYSCDEDDEDTARGRFYLQIPYDAPAGIYTIEIEAKNDDVTNSEVRRIIVENEFSNIALRSGDSVLVLNPTNKLKVYNILTPSGESVIVVPAGSSKTVPVAIEADENGEYNFDVSVLSGDRITGLVSFSGTLSDKSSSSASAVAVLTVILAIVFVVLLIVLIVLIRKKPSNTEEFGESYY